MGEGMGPPRPTAGMGNKRDGWELIAHLDLDPKSSVGTERSVFGHRRPI